MLSGDMNLGVDGDVAMDEKQLSADLDGMLKIRDGGGLKTRGNGRPDSPKKENLFSPCRFMRQSALGSGEAGEGPGYSYQSQQQPPSNQYHQPHSSLTSDNDLETDRDQSITQESHVISDYFQNGVFENKSKISRSSYFDPSLQSNVYPQGKIFANSFRLEQGHTIYKPELGLPSNDNFENQQIAQDPPNDLKNIHQDALTETLVIEPDEHGECALHLLSVVEDKAIMAVVLDLLLVNGVVPQCINLQNKAKQTPLFLAVQAENIPLIGWLLQNGAYPNIQGTVRQDRDIYVWRAPLHIAAAIGDSGLGILHLLINAGADVNAFTIAERLTPLHVALKCHSETFNCRKTILALIKAGAMIASISEQRSSKTPLIMAIETRDLDLVRDMLEQFDAARCRALLQEQTRSGDTCLHIAAGLSRITSQEKQYLLRLLIIKGANGNIPNNVKELPRDYARLEWDKIRMSNT